MDRSDEHAQFQTDNTRRSISVHRNLLRAWTEQPYNYSKRNDSYKRNRYYKYLPAVILSAASILSPAQVLSETIGGVSATAAPVANSSGSVTNQAIQVLQGPYITNTYGGGIQCQGPTLNITPYVTGAVSAMKPYEDYYMDPVYDMSDEKGAFDENGNEIGDGILDNPGSVQFYRPVRTGQKDNYNLSLGFSATWSRPLDKKLQDQCKEAAAANIALMRQQHANKRLDFEIARLKNCGELLKQGIRFHPRSPYAAVCADVVVQNVNSVPQHRHSIPKPTSSVLGTQNEESSQHHSSDAAQLGGPLQTRLGASYPVRRQSSSVPSSSQVSPLLTKDQQEVLQAVPR